MSLWSPRLTAKEMLPFVQSLATSCAGGIPIARCFALIGEKTRNKKVRDIARGMAERLNRGETMEEALNAHALWLPRLFIATIVVGERSGKLHIILPALSRHYVEALALQRAFVRQVTYPLCILFVAVYCIPYFKGIIDPRVDAYDFTINYLWSLRMHAVYFGAWMGILYSLNYFGLLSPMLDPVLQWVWPAGKIVRKFCMARFYLCLSLLLDSGESLYRSVVTAAPVTANRSMTRRLLRAAPAIHQGDSLPEILTSVRVAGRDQIAMIEVAEQSGSVVEMLERMSRQLILEARHPVMMFISVLEALLIILIGAMVVL